MRVRVRVRVRVRARVSEEQLVRAHHAALCLVRQVYQ